MAGVEPADAQDEARHERCQRSPSHGAPLLLESQDGRVRLVIWVQELRQQLEETPLLTAKHLHAAAFVGRAGCGSAAVRGGQLR